MQASPLPPVQPPVNVGTQVVVQSNEKDPIVMYEQFRKRGATEFRDTKDVLKADEWLEHIEDVFGTVIYNQKQRDMLASSMLREVTKTWWKSVSDAFLKCQKRMFGRLPITPQFRIPKITLRYPKLACYFPENPRTSKIVVRSEVKFLKLFK